LNVGDAKKKFAPRFDVGQEPILDPTADRSLVATQGLRGLGERVVEYLCCHNAHTKTPVPFYFCDTRKTFSVTPFRPIEQTLQNRGHASRCGIARSGGKA